MRELCEIAISSRSAASGTALLTAARSLPLQPLLAIAEMLSLAGQGQKALTLLPGRIECLAVIGVSLLEIAGILKPVGLSQKRLGLPRTSPGSLDVGDGLRHDACEPD